MRIDPDHCDDPVLLAAEVRRLRNARSYDHWDAICQEGEKVSREEGYKAMQAEVAALHAECERLRLTDAEREAVQAAIDSFTGGADFNDQRGWPATAQRLRFSAATLRGLVARLSENGDCPAPDNTAERDNDRSQFANCDAKPTPPSTPGECTVPPEWTSRPYWVDPPSGWQYGFPRLYDPAKDGDMRAWMIRHGYPKKLANLGLPCTFTEWTDSALNRQETVGK